MVRQNDVKYVKGIYRKKGVPYAEELVFLDNILYVNDAELQDMLPFSFQIYHMPGHSKDMNVIILPEVKVIFSGDMLINATTPFILHSVVEYCESLLSIKDLVIKKNIDYLIPGHGKTAKVQTEILDRIDHEISYVKKMVSVATKLQTINIPENQIKKRLYQISNDFENLHSHQTNVQTLLREIDQLDDFHF